MQIPERLGKTELLLLSSIIAFIGIMVGSVLWLAKHDRPVAMKHYKEIMERESYLEKELRKLKKEFAQHSEHLMEMFYTL